MRTSNFFDKYFDNLNLSNTYEFLYEYIYVVCDFSFNYCPIHYQMLYFYFPILYLILRSKKKNDLYDESHNSTLNYLFLLISGFTKKLLNSNFISHVLTVFYKNIFYYLKVFFQKTLGFWLTYFLTVFKKNHLWLTWKPIFKKFSYFGIFSFIRSKWYKNK